MEKKILIITGCIVILGIGIFGGVQSYRLYTTKQQLGQCLRDVESARERAREYEKIVESAKSTTRDLGESLSRQVSTVSDLRRQLEEIRRCYEEMENYINSSWEYDSITDNNHSGTDSSDSK